MDENYQIDIPPKAIDFIIDIIIKAQAPDFFNQLKKNHTIKQEFSRLKENFKKHFPAYIKSVTILFHLNLVLCEYVSIVRYPIGEEFENPALTFNSNNPLVQLMPTFLKHCKFAIKGISDFQLLTTF